MDKFFSCRSAATQTTKSKTVREPCNYPVKEGFEKSLMSDMMDIRLTSIGSRWQATVQNAYLDTGCEQSLVSQELVGKMGLKIEAMAKNMKVVNSPKVRCVESTKRRKKSSPLSVRQPLHHGDGPAIGINCYDIFGFLECLRPKLWENAVAHVNLSVWEESVFLGHPSPHRIKKHCKVFFWILLDGA